MDGGLRGYRLTCVVDTRVQYRCGTAASMEGEHARTHLCRRHTRAVSQGALRTPPNACMSMHM